jgi:acyl-homoserine-lactone acylase
MGLRRLAAGWRGAVAAALALSAVVAPAAVAGPAQPAAPAYRATIIRTAYGIPHIIAGSWGSLGYGVGFSFASDDLCTMALDYLTVDGDRSRYLSPSASYSIPAIGISVTNLDSDIYYKSLVASGEIQHLLAIRSGPDEITPTMRQLIGGYVDGYNAYLASVGGARGVSDPTCRDKPWVRPITVMDEYLRLYQLVELASKDVVIPGIAEAAPPADGVVPSGVASLPATPATALGPGSAGLPTLRQLQLLGRRLAAAGVVGAPTDPAHPTGGFGSNAVAVGSVGTRDGRHGLLIGNPHFPWDGTERFYEMQLTIPHRLNVYGATLFGVPLVLIGFTDTMAWSHTVSTAYRFTPYQLTLVPGNPTEYVYGGQVLSMTTKTVDVTVRGADGRLSTVRHTLYFTRFGPVFNSIEGVPLPWTSATAFAIADVNADNFRVFNHFLATDQARSVAQELSILKRYEGIPWVNTIVADSTGHTLYADIGAIPHVTDAEAHSCDTALGAVTFADLRLPILDGSDPSCGWGTDADSVAPGTFGAKEEPYLLRSDFVENSNDSFWLSNPYQPLTGYPMIIGDTGTARSLRTRSALTMVMRRVNGSDGLGPAGFTFRDMQNLFYSDIQYGASLVRSQLVAMCRSFPAGMAPTSSGTPVPVGNSCDTLAFWNGREDLGSRGAVLFRDFWERALALPEGPWLHPFSASDPVNTPYGLNPADPSVQRSFGDALQDMSAAGLPYDVALGAVQYVVRDGHRIPIPGGPGDPDGEFNAIYQDVVHARGVDPSIGSSYVQVVGWNSGSSCPEAATVLTYSESTNPRSPYFADQTLLFSRSQWAPTYFCLFQVESHAVTTTAVYGRGGGRPRVTLYRPRRA